MVRLSNHLCNNNVAVVKFKREQHSTWEIGIALMENNKVSYIIPDWQGFGDPKECNIDLPDIPKRVYDYQFLPSLEG